VSGKVGGRLSHAATAAEWGKNVAGWLDPAIRSAYSDASILRNSKECARQAWKYAVLAEAAARLFEILCAMEDNE
jgi:hypothetical protein